LIRARGLLNGGDSFGMSGEPMNERDTLKGGAGDDELVGGGDNDLLVGEPVTMYSPATAMKFWITQEMIRL
jgi:Ca2+-binding RTX toxin-like protein